MSLAYMVPVLIGALLLVVIGLMVAAKKLYVKVPQGTALIINDTSSVPKVRFTGGWVVPVIHKAELMKISLITLDIDRRGKEGLICRDNMRADIRVFFYLRVNEKPDDVLRVAKAVGVARASEKNAVDELFNAKFSEALKTVGKKFDFVDLFEKRLEFRNEIVKVIGNDLNGYVLEDVAIDYLEQTPKALLDASNIMDAEGIRKITELTASQNIITNELAQNERLAITKKNVETREATLALERQQAEAEARQLREIQTIQAREQAETARVQEEQRIISENARIEAQQTIEIRDQNRLREVEVAEQNRQRAVAIEAERVERARQLERVTTDREVQMQIVERDKAVEDGRREVANVVRERVQIEQTVAVAEEKINETREVSAADRAKQVVVLNAEAEAQEELVRTVRAAEAAAQSAQFRAQEITTIADAELAAAGKQSEAKRVLAEGVKVERAAPGLADAMVQEANAQAIEKTGVAEARVQEAKADARYKEGNAEARILSERLAAEAEGTRAMGQAEADSLSKRFEAMSSMSDDARKHDEFRMQLENSLRQALAAIEAGKEVSQENAKVLSEAMKSAKIELIGGDGGVFEALTKGMSLGKALDGFTSESPIVQQLLGRLAGLNLGSSAGKASE